MGTAGEPSRPKGRSTPFEAAPAKEQLVTARVLLLEKPISGAEVQHPMRVF